MADSPLAAIRREANGEYFADVDMLLADCRFAPNPPYAQAFFMNRR